MRRIYLLILLFQFLNISAQDLNESKIPEPNYQKFKKINEKYAERRNDALLGSENFESSHLPIFVINTGGAEIEDEPKIAAHLGIIDNPGGINRLTDTFNVYDGRIGIEIRGHSSQMFPKKSYAFETQNNSGENLNVPILGMPEENDWILYAPYSDKSLLRNVFTFEMAHKLYHYSSRTAYCELFINDEYKGLYVLMERIKIDKNRVDIARIRPEEIFGDDLTGGYIFKIDKVDSDYVEGYSGWMSSPDPSYPDTKDIIYQYYDPEDDELVNEQREYLKERVNEAEAVLISDDFDDPETGYNKYLNTGSFVDMMIMNEIAKEVDKYRYSNFFYKKKDSKGGEIFAGPVWDFNLGYGNVDYWDEVQVTEGWRFDDVIDHEKSLIFWWKRLMEDPYFNNLATTRWRYLRENDFSDNEINKLIDSLLNNLGDASERNYERWPILGTYVWPNYDWENNSYPDEVDYFRNWLFERIAWMDANFSGRLLEPAASMKKSDNSESSGSLQLKITLFDDYLNHSLLTPEDFRINTDQSSLYITNLEALNASELIVSITSGNFQPVENANLSITVDESVLNGFRALTTNNLLISSDPGNIERELTPDIYSDGNSIFIRCDEPEYLGERMEVFSVTGNLMGTYSLDKAPLNEVHPGIPGGIYIIRIWVQGVPFMEKLFIKME